MRAGSSYPAHHTTLTGDTPEDEPRLDDSGLIDEPENAVRTKNKLGQWLAAFRNLCWKEQQCRGEEGVNRALLCNTVGLPWSSLVWSNQSLQVCAGLYQTGISVFKLQWELAQTEFCQMSLDQVDCRVGQSVCPFVLSFPQEEDQVLEQNSESVSGCETPPLPST